MIDRIIIESNISPQRLFLLPYYFSLVIFCSAYFVLFPFFFFLTAGQSFKVYLTSFLFLTKFFVFLFSFFLKIQKTKEQTKKPHQTPWWEQSYSCNLRISAYHKKGLGQDIIPKTHSSDPLPPSRHLL